MTFLTLVASNIRPPPSLWKVMILINARASNNLTYLQSKKEGKDQETINQAPNLAQDTNGKVTTSQLDITN